MSNFGLVSKVTLDETSNFGPRLTTFDGSLALVWIGTDGNFNIRLSTDGINWGTKRTTVAGGSTSPALGTGGSGVIGPTQILAIPDGEAKGTISLQQFLTDALGPWSAGAPNAFSSFAISLSESYIAWADVAGSNLHVGTCALDYPDPGNIADVRIDEDIVSQETSDAGPWLCDFNGETLIGWRGHGNAFLNVAQVSGGNIVNKVSLGETSLYTPSLAPVVDNLYLAWTGDGNDQLNIMVSANGYSSFGDKTELSDSSGSGPALASYHNAIFMAWRGNGNNYLNVARVTGPGL